MSNDLYIMHEGVDHTQSTPGSGRYHWGTKLVKAASTKTGSKALKDIKQESATGLSSKSDIDRELRTILSRRAYNKYKENKKEYLSQLTTQDLEDYVRRKRAERAYLDASIAEEPAYSRMREGEEYLTSLAKIGATSLALAGSVVSIIVGIKILTSQ